MRSSCGCLARAAFAFDRRLGTLDAGFPVGFLDLHRVGDVLVFLLGLAEVVLRLLGQVTPCTKFGHNRRRLAPLTLRPFTGRLHLVRFEGLGPRCGLRLRFLRLFGRYDALLARGYGFGWLGGCGGGSGSLASFLRLGSFLTFRRGRWYSPRTFCLNACLNASHLALAAASSPGDICAFFCLTVKPCVSACCTGVCFIGLLLYGFTHAPGMPCPLRFLLRFRVEIVRRDVATDPLKLERRGQPIPCRLVRSTAFLPLLRRILHVSVGDSLALVVHPLVLELGTMRCLDGGIGSFTRRRCLAPDFLARPRDRRFLARHHRSRNLGLFLPQFGFVCLRLRLGEVIAGGHVDPLRTLVGVARQGDVVHVEAGLHAEQRLRSFHRQVHLGSVGFDFGQTTVRPIRQSVVGDTRTLGHFPQRRRCRFGVARVLLVDPVHHLERFQFLRLDARQQVGGDRRLVCLKLRRAGGLGWNLGPRRADLRSRGGRCDGGCSRTWRCRRRCDGGRRRLRSKRRRVDGRNRTGYPPCLPDRGCGERRRLCRCRALGL